MSALTDSYLGIAASTWQGMSIACRSEMLKQTQDNLDLYISVDKRPSWWVEDFAATFATSLFSDLPEGLQKSLIIVM